MKVFAYAKINLGLDVLRRRSDGYHEVRMIMQSLDLCDELTFDRIPDRKVILTTDNGALPADDGNLVCRAAKLLMEEYPFEGGVRVHLKKNIPVAAGLAGGSSDAAATLKAVNELGSLGLSSDDLKGLGVRIGADVPYCLMYGTVLSEGIGEILTPLEACPGCAVLLAKPPVDVSTAYVYSHLMPGDLVHPDIDGIISGIRNKDIHEIARNTGNVLETVTVRDHPVIDKLKRMMSDNGSIAQLMSGSGPTVFGLFEEEADMQRAYESIRKSKMAGDLIMTGLYNPER